MKRAQAEGYKTFVVLLTIATAFLVAGCPGNGASTASSGGATTSATSTLGGLAGLGPAVAPSGVVGTDTPTNGGSASFITVNQVVLTNGNPFGQIDLIGANNEIGQNCGAQGACECVFSWTDGTGNIHQTQTAGLDYNEANLARCTYTSVDTTATYFDVWIEIVAGALNSNTTRVFVPSLNPQIDPTQTSNYLPVWRYMCRDLIANVSGGGGQGVNTNMYTGILDPALWDLSYGYNLYTTALGLDYGAIGAPGFECPPIPNDGSNNPAYDYNIYSLGDIDLKTPTNIALADGLGDHTIFPSTDNGGLASQYCPTGVEPTCEKYILNRHDFYLATFENGVFKQPVVMNHKVINLVNGLVLPPGPTGGVVTLTTIAASSNPPPDVIGFAAMPDQNENCPSPSVVQIPAGKKWAKLWQFKVNLNLRFANDYSNPGDIGALVCANREDSCLSHGDILLSQPQVAGKIIPGPSAGPTGSGLMSNVTFVPSVCWNTRNPTGTGLPLAPEPLISNNPTLQGYGNCNDQGTEGDGNGPAAQSGSCAKGDYLVDACASLLPGANNCDTCLTSGGFGAGCTQNPSCSGLNNCGDCNPQQVPSGRSCIAKDLNGNFFADCCMDNGAPIGQAFSSSGGSWQLPANWTPNGGQFCNPSLVGSHSSSSVANTFQYHDPTNGGALMTSTYGDNLDLTSQPVGQDVWLMGGGSVKACIEADTNGNGNLHQAFQHFPPSPNPFVHFSRPLDKINPTDTVYIVSPPTVKLGDMETPGGAIARKYTPYRVLQGSDASQRIIYTLFSGAQAVSAANLRTSNFPICVLQDAKPGSVILNSGGSL